MPTAQCWVIKEDPHFGPHACSVGRIWLSNSVHVNRLFPRHEQCPSDQILFVCHYFQPPDLSKTLLNFSKSTSPTESDRLLPRGTVSIQSDRVRLHYFQPPTLLFKITSLGANSTRGVLLGILGGGVPSGSPNSDPFYFRSKNVIFHAGLQTRPLKSIPVFRPGL